NTPFRVNTKDIFGKPALYYALYHNQMLLAYDLAVNCSADMQGLADQFMFRGRDDVLLALENKNKMTYDHWQTVIRNEIHEELCNFLFQWNGNVAITPLSDIEKKFSAQFANLFESELAKFIKQIQDEFSIYLGSAKQDLNFYAKIALFFKKINKYNLFEEMCDQQLNKAKSRLEANVKYAPKGRLEDIEQMCKQIDKQADFEKMFRECLADLENNLNKCLE